MGRTDRVKGRTRKSLRKRFRGNQYTRKTEEKQQQASSQEVAAMISKHQVMEQSKSVCLILILKHP